MTEGESTTRARAGRPRWSGIGRSREAAVGEGDEVAGSQQWQRCGGVARRREREERGEGAADWRKPGRRHMNIRFGGEDGSIYTRSICIINGVARRRET